MSKPGGMAMEFEWNFMLDGNKTGENAAGSVGDVQKANTLPNRMKNAHTAGSIAQEAPVHGDAYDMLDQSIQLSPKSLTTTGLALTLQLNSRPLKVYDINYRHEERRREDWAWVNLTKRECPSEAESVEIVSLYSACDIGSEEDNTELDRPKNSLLGLGYGKYEAGPFPSLMQRHDLSIMSIERTSSRASYVFSEFDLNDFVRPNTPGLHQSIINEGLCDVFRTLSKDSRMDISLESNPTMDVSPENDTATEPLMQPMEQPSDSVVKDQVTPQDNEISNDEKESADVNLNQSEEKVEQEKVEDKPSNLWRSYRQWEKDLTKWLAKEIGPNDNWYDMNFTRENLIRFGSLVLVMGISGYVFYRSSDFFHGQVIYKSPLIL